MEDETHDDIQEQIDNAKEHVDDALNDAHNAINAWMDSIYSIAMTRQENTTTSTQTTPCLPDSNGFWRDKDGDIWTYDGNPDHQPIYIFNNGRRTVCDTQPEDLFTWELIKPYAPFTKISNPFPEGHHHAD